MTFEVDPHDGHDVVERPAIKVGAIVRNRAMDATVFGENDVTVERYCKDCERVVG